MGDFFIEDFGDWIGDGIHDDRLVVQAACDAAKLAGGGRVTTRDPSHLWGTSAARKADGTLALAHIGEYPLRYSIMADGDDVRLEENTFKPLGDWVDSKIFCSYGCVVAGDNEPGIITNLADIRRGYGNRFSNNQVDASGLSLDQLKLMGKSSISGAFVLAAQSDFTVEENEVINGWGFTGPYTCTVGSEHGSVRKNDVHGAYAPGFADSVYFPICSAAYWMDGAHYIIVEENSGDRILSFIVFATNRDYDRTAEGNVIRLNVGRKFYGAALAVSGRGNLLTENDCETDRGSSTGILYTAFPGYPVVDNFAAQNRFAFDPSAPGQLSGTLVAYRSIGVAGSPEQVESNMALENEGVNLQALASFDSPLCKTNVLYKNNGHGAPVLFTGGALESDNVVVGNT